MSRRQLSLASAAAALALVGALVAPSAPAQTGDSGAAVADCDETLTPFDDIPASHPAAADVSCMYSLGVVKGTSATHFSPDATLTRAQMSVMLARLWVALGNGCPAGSTLPFTDVPADHWAASEIACLYSLRIVNGTSATRFSPDATLTRAQIAVMAARLWRIHGKACPTATAAFTDVHAGHWAYADIGCLQALGIMGAVSGTMFKPDDNATRLQMVMALARLWRANRTATDTPAPTTGGGGQQISVGGDGGQPPGQDFGSSQAGVPDTPTGLSLRAADSALVATWVRPAHGGNALRSYKLWYCTAAPADCDSPSSVGLSVALTSPSNPTKTITGLTNGTQYYVRVLATNGNGSSDYSSAVTGTPLGVPNVPRSLTVAGGKSGNTLIGSGKLQVAWQPPTTSNSQAAVTGYRVEHSTDGSSWTRWTGAVTGTTTKSTTVTGLTDGTAYRVRVQATSSVGGSDWAQSGAVRPSTKPSAPAAPAAGPPSGNTTGTSLSVSWTAPTDNGGAAITDYDLQYRACTATPLSCATNPTWESSWTGKSHTGTGTSTTITGLTEGTAYQVQARATNSNGSSGWSSSGTGTPAAVPDAPAAPTVSIPTSNNTGTSLNVSWTAPDDNSSAITDYDVQYRACTATPKSCATNPTWESSWTGKSHTGTGTSATLTGLTRGTAYQVQVRAANSVGSSAWSSSGSATPATVPATPGRPTVSIPTSSNDGMSLNVSWTAPDDGGSPITSYWVSYKKLSDDTWTTRIDVTATSDTFTGLDNGAEYEFQIRATNSVGNSGWSASGNGTPAAKPSAPSAPTVSAASSWSLSVSWTAPDDNGSDITDYDVQYKKSSDSTWTNKAHSGTGRSTTITGLTPATAYVVQVRATNGIGTGAWSASSSSVSTPAAKPNAPGAPSVVGGKSGNTLIGSGKLKVTWTAPASNGSDITGYKVRYRVCTAGYIPVYLCQIRTGFTPTWSAWTDWSHSGTGTSATITGLSDGRAYQVSVLATNSVGDSPWSIAGRGVPKTTPRVPTHLDTTEVDNGTTLRVYWCSKYTNACWGDNHGDTTITYHYYWKQCADSDAATVCSPDWPDDPNRSETWTLTPAKLKLTVTGLTQGKKYGARVRGCNSIGCSGYSDMVLGTPQKIPRAPTITAARWSTLSNQDTLSITWTDPTDTGGRPLTGYDIYTCSSNCTNGPLDANSSNWTQHTGNTGTSYTQNAFVLTGTACDAIASKYYVVMSVTSSAGKGFLSSKFESGAAPTTCPVN